MRVAEFQLASGTGESGHGLSGFNSAVQGLQHYDRQKAPGPLTAAILASGLSHNLWV